MGEVKVLEPELFVVKDVDEDALPCDAIVSYAEADEGKVLDECVN